MRATRSCRCPFLNTARERRSPNIVTIRWRPRSVRTGVRTRRSIRTSITKHRGRALRARPYVWGVFVWNMFDFSSDSRNEGDLDRHQREGHGELRPHGRQGHFLFLSRELEHRQRLHLVGRRFTERAYAVIDVKAYSNATQAHLWLNGQDQGAASCAGGICLWHGIHLTQGTNDVRATADIGGVETSDTLQWTFAGSPGVVRIKAGDISGYVARDNERYGSDMYFVGGEGKDIDPPDTPVGKRSVVTGALTRISTTAIAKANSRIAFRFPTGGGTELRPDSWSRRRRQLANVSSTSTSTGNGR